MPKFPYWVVVWTRIAGAVLYPLGSGGMAQATWQSEAMRSGSATKRFQASTQAPMTSSRSANTRLDSQWERRKCQIRSAGFSSGLYGGSKMIGDAVGHHQLAAAVPGRAVGDQHGVGVRGQLGADLLEEMVHRRRVAHRHDERRRLALLRAHGAEDVGRGKAQVLRRRRPRARACPQSGQRVLLPDPRLVTEPHRDSFTARPRRGDSLEL